MQWGRTFRMLFQKRKEKSMMAWLKTDVLELRGIRAGVDNENSPNV